VFDRMTERQRLGQLFVVGTPADGSQLTVYRGEGGVFLSGRTTAGTDAVHAVVARAIAAEGGSASGVLPYISTDEEGGQVNVVGGPGFSTQPAALVQGQEPTSTLIARSHDAGVGLRKAGVNLDLAPVADTVPSNVGTNNAPIGQYDREYGNDPQTVSTAVAAVIQGLHEAGVSATVKHFPGLGRATGNTDDTAGVTDPTTLNDSYLAPYKEAIRAGADFVMVSSAEYPNIDPGHLAVFSKKIITNLLRDQMGFKGIIITDDVSAATAVQGMPPGQRAIAFLSDGGTMVLTSRDPSVASAMFSAVEAHMRADPAFAAQVNADVQLVLQDKEQHGLVPACS
jgi:beta-N-acetylhexosaminidase